MAGGSATLVVEEFVADHVPGFDKTIAIETMESMRSQGAEGAKVQPPVRMFWVRKLVLPLNALTDQPNGRPLASVVNLKNLAESGIVKLVYTLTPSVKAQEVGATDRGALIGMLGGRG